ncbi:hypothetical protein L1049_027969 [Liquidambar formosana]|uniref:Uncharacterized protein n=1 Tax=Liquidambar formosana TaxID=63359 RepID=A0AAP0RJD1_LIQFO
MVFTLNDSAPSLGNFSSPSNDGVLWGLDFCFRSDSSCLVRLGSLIFVGDALLFSLCSVISGEFVLRRPIRAQTRGIDNERFLDWSRRVVDGLPELLVLRGGADNKVKGLALEHIPRPLHIQFGSGDSRNRSFRDV